MKISVIIACYNAADTIGTQLGALAGQSWSEPWEVIVSDNGSTDQSLAAVKSFKDKIPNLLIVDSSERRGPSYARNVGARAASGEALAFPDADDEVAPGWVAAMGKALSKHDFVACRWDIEKLNKPSLRIRGNPQKTGVQVLWYPPYLPHAGASSLGVKRSLHAAVGGFDESFPRLADTDYCLRIQLTGVKLKFVPDALLHVRFRNTLGGFFNQSRLWGKYNILLYKKYRPPGKRVPRAWKRYLGDWMHLFQSIPRLRRRAGRFSFVRLFGWQIGQLQGCLEQRTSPTAFPRRDRIIADSESQINQI